MNLEQKDGKHPLSKYDDIKHAEDVYAHHEPSGFSDKVAFKFVKFLRIFADAFFAKRYGHRAVVLETVAAVPGMVGGALLHLRSLRKMEDDEGWIHTLLDEAENERMHLMTFIEIAQPNRLERFLVIFAQVIFYISYFMLYLISSKTAHRVVAYLEEEAVVSYTQYADMVESGDVENIDAPQIAIDNWNLSDDAKLLDVIRVIRADEMMHREVNHLIADKLSDTEPTLKTHEQMSKESISDLNKYVARDFPD
jgi:ubiquinol oxidase